MINIIEIDKLSIRNQISPIAIAREYCQHHFLSSFYAHKGSDKVLFKGGTALRILFKSPRFSEDLDFTGIHNITYYEIESILTEVLSDLNFWGFDINLLEAKKTTGGYLAKINFLFLKFKFILKIEISFRQSHNKKTAHQITSVKNDYIDTYTIIHLPNEEIVEGKIAALMARSKPRDWYDLYFLLKNNYLSAKQKKILPDILEKFSNYKGDIKKEMKEFLPASHQMILKDFKNSLRKEIKRYL